MSQPIGNYRYFSTLQILWKRAQGDILWCRNYMQLKSNFEASPASVACRASFEHARDFISKSHWQSICKKLLATCEGSQFISRTEDLPPDMAGNLKSKQSPAISGSSECRSFVNCASCQTVNGKVETVVLKGKRSQKKKNLNVWKSYYVSEMFGENTKRCWT